MASPQAPIPVKLVIAVLFSDEQLLQTAWYRLINEFGEIDYTSPRFPFDATDYYAPEMGESIERLFVSFSNLIPPDRLAEIKLRTNEIENELAVDNKRKINLDPGYLDTDKFVLASGKYHGFKIYLSDGIWADMTLHYEKGKFSAMPWSFPDFRSGAYNEVFIRIREIYKRNLNATAKHQG